MNPDQEQAIRQYLSKPTPYSDPCACMGGSELKSHPGRRTPECRCAMAYVETVNGHYYRIEARPDVGNLCTQYEAVLLGPVGGPYTNTTNQIFWKRRLEENKAAGKDCRYFEELLNNDYFG